MKSFDTTRILNINILSITQRQLLATLDRGVLYTPNVDHLVKLQKDTEFYDIYQKAEWVVCDSRILHRLSRLLRTPLPEAIPGSGFFTEYYMYHRHDESCRIFLLGAAEGVAAEAMRRINERVGRPIVVGAHSPSFGFEKDEAECRAITNIVNASGATVLVVGAGAPKQEKWIARYRETMPGVRLFMALGASIDFEAGHKRRAPRIWQRMGMEWFFRFIEEPRRLFKRYFIDDMKFFLYFGMQLTGLYRNPMSKSSNSHHSA